MFSTKRVVFGRIVAWMPEWSKCDRERLTKAVCHPHVHIPLNQKNNKAFTIAPPPISLLLQKPTKQFKVGPSGHWERVRVVGRRSKVVRHGRLLGKDLGVAEGSRRRPRLHKHEQQVRVVKACCSYDFRQLVELERQVLAVATCYRTLFPTHKDETGEEGRKRVTSTAQLFAWQPSTHRLPSRTY